MHVGEMISTHPHVQGNTADRLVQFIEEAYSCAQTCTSCADACLAEDMVAELREARRVLRRQQHQEGEERFLYKLPSKKSAQIRQQAKYNQEVSVLSGVAKYVGFPAAPNISGVEGSGLEDDFKAMRVSICNT